MINPQSPVTEKRQSYRVRLAKLEADIAYFQARLEMIGEPTNINQIAQRKVFKLLHKFTGGTVLQVKREYSELA